MTTDGRKEFIGLPYLLTKTRKRPVIQYRGHRYRKVHESLSTSDAFRRALKERRERPTIWTGEKLRPGAVYRGRKLREPARLYGVYTREVRVREHMRRRAGR